MLKIAAKTALAFALVAGTASAFSAYAQSPRGGRAHAIHAMAQQTGANPNAVYYDGRTIGQDPDPNVRQELLRRAQSGD
jgi:hypothetical protein